MRRTFTLLLLFLTVFFAQAHSWTGAGPAGPVPRKAAGSGPSGFTENKGQVADHAGNSRPDVLYALTGGTVKVYLTKKGIIYSYIQVGAGAGEAGDARFGGEGLSTAGNPSVRTYQVEMHWAGADPGVNVRAEEPTGETSTYYLPHCPAGVSGARSFGRVRYENIYPHVDLVFYFTGQQLKYDFIVKPGGRVEDIRLRYEGAGGIEPAPDGSVRIANPLGSLTEGKPFTYQLRNGRVREVKASYRAKANGLGFRVDSAAYDRSRPLVIDPALLWSTYYGGASLDHGGTVVTGPDGSVYLAGHTQSASGISAAGHLTTASGGTDAFLVKFSPDGARAWATYYGGTNREEARGLAVDAAGNVYLAGTTWSQDNIAAGGHQPASGGTFDAFLVKFDAGGRRQWATFYGGDYGDAGNAVSTDAGGNVYLAGETFSPTGIAAGGYQNSIGHDNIFTNKDAFLVKFNAAGVRQWGTYYGGTYVQDYDVFSNTDAGHSVCTDAAGNVYLAGATTSPHGMALNGHQSRVGGYNKNYPNHQLDAFVVKFDGAGRRQWATYYGGDEYDEGHAIRADADGNVYLAGQTYSATGIATVAAHQPALSGSSDGFLVQFNAAGVRQWGTYFGGTGDEAGMALSLYANGYVYLAGTTGSSTGIYYQGYSVEPSGVFLARFSTAGARDYGTYFGGAAGQSVFRNAVAVDASHHVLLAGTTNSSTAVAWGGYQRKYAGAGDVFLAKFTNAPIPAPAISGLGQTSGPAGAQVLVTGNHFTGVSSVQFNGVEADFTLQSSTQLLATVPTDARSGALRISTTGGTATSSQVFTVTSYCTSASRFNSDSRIENVSFSNVNNTSNTDCSLKYADYTATPAYVAPGQSLALGVRLGTCHQFNRKTGKVFIDWNGDYDFEDAEELVFTSPVITYASTFGGTVTVPAGVSVGASVRMRVVCVDTDLPEAVVACGQYDAYGETEDYTLTFVPFTALPAIGSVSPADGEAGTAVALTGTGFTNVQAVRFNGVEAVYTVNGPGSITATVPNGATTGRITVITDKGTAVSPSNYTVTTQSYTMRDGVQTITTCGAISLGPNGTAGGNTSVRDGTITFTPDSPGGKIRITFLSVNMPWETDATLLVYDAATITGRSSAWLFRTTFPPTPITATNATGQLTLHFSTNYQFTAAGWQARVECIRPPQITALSPGQGAIGSTVTIAGAHLTGTTAVRFNGTDAMFTLTSANQIVATVPHGATTGNVTVINAAGTATSAAYTVIPRPVISRFTPDKGLPGSTLVVDGTQFTGATSVRINGVDVPFTVNSATRITATVAEAATNGAVSVTTPGGTDTYFFTNFTVVRQPSLAGFSPSKGPVNGAVTLTGSNLRGTASVRFNGLEAAFTVVDDTRLTTFVPVGATTGRITVSNAAGAAESSIEFIVDGISYCTSKATEQRGNVLAVYFGSIGDENIACSGYQELGSRGTAVVPGQAIPLKIRTKAMCMEAATTGAKLKAYVDWNVDGDFTDAGETVYTSDNGMGDHAATVVVPAGIPTGKMSRLRIVLTAGMDSQQPFWPYYRYFYPLREPQSCGEYPVGQTVDYHVQLTATAMPPRVASFSPGFGPTGTPVTLRGKNLTATSAVDFNGVAATFSVANDSVLVAEVPAGALSGPIRVTAGFSTATSPDGFVAPPSISGFSPRNSAVGSLLSISGRNFTGTTAVRLGSREAVFVAGANNVITATVPAGFTSGRITVVNPAGTAVSVDTFSIFPPPAIHHVTPVTGPAGTLVTLTGENLDNPVSVHFNGVAAPRFEAKSTTTLNVTAPAGTTAGNITVVTAGGRATTSTAFTPIASPRITGFTPTSGNGSTTVTVTGENFTDVRDVRIGTYRVPYRVNSATQLVIAVPPGIGPGTVAVTTAGGTATSSGMFAFSRDPFITRVSPGRNSFGTAPGASHAVRFSEPMQADLAFPSLISVRGSQSGFHPVTPGSIVGRGTDSLSFLPAAGLRPGERVQVTFAGGLRAANGLALTKPLVYDFTTAPAKAAAQFTPTGTTLAGPFAADLCVGDWDGDGDLDVVTANSNPQTLSVRMNDGTGTFTGTTEIALASPLLRVLAADLEQDGDLDLVAGCYNNFTLLLNDGTGVFAVQPNTLGYSYNQEACVADFDGDGDVDIAGYSPGTSQGWVQVWKNDGKGAFSSGGLFTAGDYPHSLWPGDFDNDGDVDLVAASLDNYNTDTYLLLNDGTGAFPASKTIRAGVQTKLARSEDFDGDGDLDLALLCSVHTYGQPTLYVIFNDGQGNFSPGFNDPVSYVNIPETLTTADFDGDGDADIAITTSNANGDTFVRFNDGTGGFAPPIAVPMGTSRYGVEAGDLDGDGDLDLLTLQYDRLSVALNGGTVVAPRITAFAPARGAKGTQVTLTGSNFTGATRVTFNGTAAGYTVVSSTQIIATVPEGAQSGGIRVTSPQGQDLSKTGFVVVPTPALASFAPAEGPTGTVVALRGSHLDLATGVLFNGVPAAFTVVSATSLTAVVPEGGVTGKITVTAQAGTVTSATDFRGIALPVITEFSPATASANQGISITGRNFATVSSVKINGVPARIFSLTDTYLYVSVPEPTGLISITNAAGTVHSTTPIVPAHAMQDNPITACQGTYSDANGTGNYYANENRTQAIAPGTPGGRVQLTFTELALETSYDFLYIYDGPDRSAPLLAKLTGFVSPGTIAATSPSGQLTLHLVTDRTNHYGGWKATLSCLPGCALTAVAVAEPPACPGSNTGRISLGNAAGGSGSYAYSLDGVSYQDAPVFESLRAGAYTVRIKDKSSGCVSPLAVAVTDPAPLAGLVSFTHPDHCNAANGSITVATVTGGRGPYAYSLDGTSFAGTASFANLAAGSYTLTIKDATGCTTTLPVVLSCLPAPANLTAEALPGNLVELRWTDPAVDETGFEIYRAPAEAGPYALLATAAADEPRFTDQGLNPGSSYFYKVRAKRPGGYSDFSGTVAAMAIPALPASPSDLVAEPVDAWRVGLRWQHPSGNEAAFEIYRAEGAGSFARVAEVAAGTTAYEDTGLAPRSAYRYQVRAVNAAGSSAFSNEATATTLPEPPAAPADVRATVLAATGVELTWTHEPGGVQAYRVERATGDSGSFAQIATLPADTRSFTATDLAPNTTYFFRLAAVGEGGSSPYSEAVSVTTPSVVTGETPAAPDALSATAVSATQIEVAWAYRAGSATGFEVFRSTGPDGAFGKIAEVTAGVTSYRDEGLTAATPYVYKVLARNAVGSSAFSNEAGATTWPLPPAAPGGVEAVVAVNRIQLGWTDRSDNETGFLVEVSEGDSLHFAQAALPGANATLYQHEQAVPGRTYYFRVYAVNAGGRSAGSAVVWATLPAVPNAPAQLLAAGTSPTEVYLSWTDRATDETGFVLERSVGDNAHYRVLAQLPADATSYQDTELTANTQYFYRLRAVNGEGSSGYSNEASATTAPYGSLAAATTVYPNPSRGLFNFELNTADPGEVRISVLNQMGIVLQTASFQKGSEKLTASVDLQTVPGGMYYLHVYTAYGSAVKVLLKQ